MPIPTKTADCNFKLSGSSSAFGARTKDIFATLDSIEAKHAAFESTSAADGLQLLKPDPEDDDSSIPTAGPSSGFKVPSSKPKARRSKYLPGHQANPEKWKMYDLSDVSPDQLTNAANSSVALDFLCASTSSSASAGQMAPPDCSETSSSAMETGANLESCSKHIFRKPSRGSVPGQASRKRGRSDGNTTEENSPDGSHIGLEHIETTESQTSSNLGGSHSDAAADETEPDAVHFKNAKTYISKGRRHVRSKDTEEDSDEETNTSLNIPKKETQEEDKLDDDDEITAALKETLTDVEAVDDNSFDNDFTDSASYEYDRFKWL